MSSGRVAGKVALITGASSGIGAASAFLLAREGAIVLLSDIDERGIQSVAAAITESGDKAHCLPLDVASEQEWKDTMTKIKTDYGHLDILVNNAGVLQVGSVSNTSFEQWRKLQSVNSDGMFLGVKYGVELMRELQIPGSIINLCSILGQVGTRECCAYSASKGSVKLLTKSVALDEAPYGIRVNNVCPAYIETPLLNVIPREEYNALVALHPMKRLGTPEDVASAILFLASDESSFITGSELMVDGGYTAV